MKILKLTLLSTLLTLAWLPYANAQMQGNRQAGDRFERMDRLMERMQSSRDTGDRQEMMHEHMQMMQQQMQDMNCMMGEGTDCPIAGGAGGPSARQGNGGMQGGMSGGMGGGMGSGDNSGMGSQEQMQAMQQRMDMMHRMMGHMLDQQQMMMDMESGAQQRCDRD